MSLHPREIEPSNSIIRGLESGRLLFSSDEISRCLKTGISLVCCVASFSLLPGCGGDSSGANNPPSGNPSGNPPQSATTPSNWATPTLVSAVASPIEPAPIAIDGSGNAFAAINWGQNNTTAVVIVRKPVGSPWGAEEFVSPIIVFRPDVTRYWNVDVHADETGNAVASWTFVDRFVPSDRQFTSQVYVNHYRGALAWSGPQLLQSSPSAYAHSIKIHMQRDGMAWAAWVERTFTDQFFSVRDQYAVFAARYTPQRGWSTPEKISGDYLGALKPRIATNGKGDPMVFYEQFILGGTVFYATVRDTVGTWSVPELVFDVGNNNGFGPDPDFAVDGDRNAFVVWQQYDGVRQTILTRRYTVANGWETPVELTIPSNDNAFAPRVAMDEQGNAFVLWHEFEGEAFGIWAARFERAVGWTELEIVSSPPATFGDDATFPKIAFDAAGNAIAVWTNYVFSPLNRTVVKTSRYTRASGWGVNEMMSGGGVARLTSLAVSPSGRAAATWAEEDTSPTMPLGFRTWSAFYGP